MQLDRHLAADPLIDFGVHPQQPVAADIAGKEDLLLHLLGGGECGPDSTQLYRCATEYNCALLQKSATFHLLLHISLNGMV
jgi:hypothetical protein